MNPIGDEIAKQVGTQVGGFMDIMRSQPLSLALVMMNVLLIAYLFYSQSQTLSQRKDALDQIVAWQRQTDQLMASCVSGDVMKLVINSLERDRELYRNLLPSFRQDGGGTAPLFVPPPVLKPDELVLPKLVPPPGPKLQSDEDRPATPEEIENLFKIPP